MTDELERRKFLKQMGAAGIFAMAPMSLVELVWGREHDQKFTFAYISDSHLTHNKKGEFVRNFDNGLKRAVTETNFLSPKPDFVVYGGDLAQLGKREEIDHGLELMSGLRVPVKWVIGEHDYYLDLGEYWQKKVSPLYYSFDHKGVHFVVLNSILTYDDWLNKWSKDPMGRMLQMARLDNPQGSPFMVKDPQIEWMRKDLTKIDSNTPVVILSHSPLYKIFKPWNFWTEDAEKVQKELKRFRKVTVLHGHVHQVLYHQIGNITFNAMMSTAWPWPYPVTYNQAKPAVPKLTVFMNRADPHSERDGTGWGYIDLETGRASHHYELWENAPRKVNYDPKSRKPRDTVYQDPKKRIPPQNHY